LQALEAEEQRAVAEATVQETAAAEAEETAGRAEGAVGVAGGRLQALQAAVAQAQQESAALEGRRQACEREREQALSALRRAEGEAARLQAQFAALAGRLEAGFGLTVDALTGVAPSERPEADRARADALREELGAIGGVRPESVDEHRREAEEVAALAAAVDDVRRTAAELLEAARRIEGQLGQRYEETLATVRRQFAASYERLCGGGRADLVPVAAPSAAPGPGSGPGGGAPAPAGPLRPADAPGLEIVAQPPGKQPAHLELLSGGERTLVAVALLLALLRVRPTAFCILDEVEAALDDANVERCARFLREMAEGTQFIVVTHQKGTMEAADRLVGVTMGESGVSTLLSVRLAG
jgi:chromosome segregation protein